MHTRAPDPGSTHRHGQFRRRAHAIPRGAARHVHPAPVRQRQAACRADTHAASLPARPEASAHAPSVVPTGHAVQTTAHHPESVPLPSRRTSHDIRFQRGATAARSAVSAMPGLPLQVSTGRFPLCRRLMLTALPPQSEATAPAELHVRSSTMSCRPPACLSPLPWRPRPACLRVRLRDAHSRRTEARRLHGEQQIMRPPER